MRWGLTYPLQGIPLSQHGPILREAEEIGYTDAWTAEVDANDALTPLAAFGAWTKTTRLGCAIAGIYNRTPTLLAQSAAAIEELSPGRFCLGIGTSSPVIVERWNGVKLEQPLKRTRDTIAFLRQAWSGEKVVMKVGPYDVKGFRLGRAPVPPPKLYLAALREKMLRLAGETCDGAITNYIAPEDARKVAAVTADAAKAAGKDAAKFDLCLDSGRYAGRVKQDFREGTQAGVNGTPAIFVNGRPMSGAVPFEDVAKIIREEMARGGS